MKRCTFTKGWHSWHFVRFLGLAFFSLIQPAANLFGQPVFELTEQSNSANTVDLRPYLHVITQPGSEPLLFSTVAADLPLNRPYTFRLRLRNSTAEPVVTNVQFGEHFVFATNIRVGEKSIDGLQNIISLTLAPSDTTVIRFDLRELDRLNPEQVSVRLASVPFRTRDLQIMLTTQSFFLGLFGFLAVFYLIIYLVTHWRVYAKYSTYIFIVLLYFAYYYGVLQEEFPTFKAVSINLISSWYSLVFVSYFFFLNEFGQYRIYSPWGHKLLNIGIINKLVQLVIETALNPFGVEWIYSSTYKNIILVCEITLMISIIYFILKNKDIRGRIVILASLVLIAGAIYGQLDVNVAMRGIILELSVAIDLLIFSVALGYVTRQYYIGQQKAQAELINQLTQNQLLQESIHTRLEQAVRERTAELEQSNQENKILLTETHHRIKNNLQFILSLINLQIGQIQDVAAREALVMSRERIRAIGTVHETLYLSNNFGSISLSRYINDIISNLSLQEAGHLTRARFDLQIVDLMVSREQAIPLGLILFELVTNSIKHGPSRDLLITIRNEIFPGKMCLEYSDNGNSSGSCEGGFGRYIISILARQLKGEEQHDGFHYRFHFPNLKLAELGE